MASLQDQLLKAGLTTKQKAKQANTQKRKAKKQKQSGAVVEATLQEQVKQNLAKQRAEKQIKDAELNAIKKAELEKKEIANRIFQILQHHQVKGVDGELEYNYTFGNKIKKLFINDKTQKALANGRLALCGLNEITYLVTAETAEKVAQIDNNVVLMKNEKVTQDIEQDDPYAEFQIPDDLMW